MEVVLWRQYSSEQTTLKSTFCLFRMEQSNARHRQWPHATIFARNSEPRISFDRGLAMRPLVVLLVSLTSLAFGLRAQKPAWKPAPGHITLRLWPQNAPGAEPNVSAEVASTTATDNLIAGKPLERLGNVSNPTLTRYEAKGKNTGTAVLVFPGGGYHILAIDLEGTEVCEWLNSAGITCVLLKYRVPDSGPYPKSSAAAPGRPTGDRIFARSREGMAYHDSKRIGVLGFPAGAHLAAALSTHFEQRLYDPIDAADQLSCRPDFAVIVYPGYLCAYGTKLCP